MIKVNNVSKLYRLGVKDSRKDTFGESILSWLKSPLKNYQSLKRLTSFEDDSDDILEAIKDVSFTINEGDVLGIIGKNGAGKSTLLKILSRITEPTSGTIEIDGRVASLLEVGTGFHPELTGRENVFLNGTILGMTKNEVKSKFDEIIDFSGIERFIDTPVKRYSSGMKVRLAFAVAAHLDPEILVIDEVLAVGDVEFQKKCLGKMRDVAGSGRTVLFVSHNMGAIQNLCSRGIVLNNGKMVFQGNIKESINYYLNNKETNQSADIDLLTIPRVTREKASILLTRFIIKDTDNRVSNEFKFGEPLHFELEVLGKSDEKNFSVILYVETEEGQRIFTSASDEVKKYYSVKEDERIKIYINYNGLMLVPGSYSIGLILHRGKMGPIDQINNFTSIKVNELTYGETQPFKNNWGLIRFNPIWS